MADLTAAEANSIDASGDPVSSLYTLGTRLRNLELKATNLGFNDSIALESFREIASNDYQTIATKAAGVLGANSTNVRLKRVNGATNKCARLEFVSGKGTGVSEIATTYALPNNVDTAQAITISFRARFSTGATSNSLHVQTQFNELSARVSSVTALTSAYAQVVHTISAANVPSGAASLSIVAMNGNAQEAAENIYVTGVRIKGGTTPETS
jgi:hypothetical protein